MDVYVDTKDADDLIKQLKELETPYLLIKTIEENFPQWIIYNIEDYSDDYSILRDNWHKLCYTIKCNPQRILVVDFISFDKDKYKVLGAVLDCLTKFGYCVRRKTELVKCKKCGKALLSKKMHNLMVANEMIKKNAMLKLPKVWKSSCVNC